MDSIDRPFWLYLDQNIIGYLHCEALQLLQLDHVVYIYSDEHFLEISRGGDLTMLSTLEKINAKRIYLDIDENFNLIGTANIDSQINPHDAYKKYLDHCSDFPFDQGALIDFTARLFGSNDINAARAFPARFLENVHALVADVDDTERASELRRAAKQVADDLDGLIETQLDTAIPLEEIRQSFGTDRGRIGNLNNGDVVAQILAIVESSLPGFTAGIFGASASASGEDNAQRAYHQIVTLHGLLNLVGFNPDKGQSNACRLAGAWSDARHTAMAAYCDAVMSDDRRFRAKAKAIYRHLGIHTQVLPLPFDRTQPST